MNLPTRLLKTRVCLWLLVASALILAGGCSQQGAAPATPSASAQAAANEAAANDELKLYRAMLEKHNNALAASLGQEIVGKYPDTPAAAEVRKTLPKIAAAAKAEAEETRLTRLWLYQKANVEGAQHTASIYADGHERSSAEPIRLVLRRHQKWGLSVYLFGSGMGFVCKSTCKLPMRFDGKTETWKAYLPETGEPAMFIKSEKRFIAALEKSKVIEMDVVTKDHGKQTLKFEVGGYDPAKFPPLPKT